MVDGESEIDDPKFFLAKNGKNNAQAELNATLDALFNEKTFDDNSTACRFPARKRWLQEQLNIQNLVTVECTKYKQVLKRIDPKSATLIFPAAHINSPASMFGHTFLRINSAYKSRLLSYAINYAADANPDNTNAAVFAIKGLFGGYFGKYSLLPYYDKLKEYRETEHRDIWEYDLNLKEDEVERMLEHIWELNGTQSYYYFFTENCSYNMLWLIEIARPSLHLREEFMFDVIPLETAHILKEKDVISNSNYRPSKRTILLKYENLLNSKNLTIPKRLVNSELKIDDIIKNKTITLKQKQYILEAAIEYLEYSFSRNNMSKEKYLKMFHLFSKKRAALGKGEYISIKTPENPLDGHRAVRINSAFGVRDGENIGFIGFRPAYHDIEDPGYGFLRGTEIEFLNIELSFKEKELEVEEATLISITSLAQRSEFFDTLSWRTKLSWDKNSLIEQTSFTATLGAGYSWGNKYGYTYVMIDPLLYVEDGLTTALGGSLGFVFDKYDFFSTNIELTHRYYDDAEKQNIVNFSQNFKVSQNFLVKLQYDFIERKLLNEETFKVDFHYYF